MIREGKAAGWLYAPDSEFDAWAREQDIKLNAVRLRLPTQADPTSRGLMATKNLTTGPDETESLMLVPSSFLITEDFVNEIAEHDPDWAELLDALGGFGSTPRGAILTYMLYQCFLLSPDAPDEFGMTSPWQDYLCFLPLGQLPTLWSIEEQFALQGTSLHPATEAKTKSLQREFAMLQHLTRDIDWCAEYWWDNRAVSFDDWLQVDAWWRSRALELPDLGHCMAPGLDMANHASGAETLATWEADSKGNMLLLMQPNKTLTIDQEVTISYGDGKGACEMLYSYGFLEQGMRTANSVMLNLKFRPDDPLNDAKTSLQWGPPGVKFHDVPLHSEHHHGIEWTSDFAWLVCVNEEDGFSIRERPQTEQSEGEAVVYWHDEEINDLVELRAKVKESPMHDIILLRVIVTLEERALQQLEYLTRDPGGVLRPRGPIEANSPLDYAIRLRQMELDHLRRATEMLAEKKMCLAQQDDVAAYLASMIVIEKETSKVELESAETKAAEDPVDTSTETERWDL